MRKITLFFTTCLMAILLMGGGFLQAQTDVTDTYLTNAGFESGPSYTDASTQSGTRLDKRTDEHGSFDIPGWTNEGAYGTYERLLTVPYSTSGSGGPFNFTSPSNGSSVLSGNDYVLVVKTHWNASPNYIDQTVSLPAGAYLLKFDSYVQQTANNATYNCGVVYNGNNYFVAKPATTNTWYNHEQFFELSSETDVTFRFGYTKSANTGGGDSPILYIDNVTLLYGTDISDLYDLESASPSTPVNVTTAFIKNPQADNGITNWTLTGNTGLRIMNNEHYSGVTNPYFDTSSWDSNIVGTASQTITGLPAGYYQVKVAARGAENGNMTFFANSESAPVSLVGNQGGDLSRGWNWLELSVTLGPSEPLVLKMDFNNNSSEKWFSFDDFQLYYTGPVLDPILSASESNFFLSDNVKSKSFLVTGLNLTDDIVITTSENSGLTVDIANIDKDEEDLDTGIEVTVTYNPNSVAGAITNGSISISSGEGEEALSKTITVKSFKNPTPDNLLGLAMGNGHTGAGSEPSTFGWAYSAAVTWSEASGNNYFNRFRDDLYGSRVLTFNKNTAVLSYPVVLEAGQSYLFSCNTTHINAGPFDTTFGINSLPDATGTMVAQQTQSVIRWNGVETLVNFTFDFTATESGTHYLVWTTTNSGERTATGDLELQKLFTVTFNSNGGSAVDALQVVKGDKIVEPTAPTKGGHDFLGWFIDAELETAWDFDADEVSSNLTLYAGWDPGTGLNAANNTVINTEYFTLQGVKVDRPIENGVYLMKRSYISGKTEVIKAFYKAQ